MAMIKKCQSRNHKLRIRLSLIRKLNYYIILDLDILKKRETITYIVANLNVID